MNPAAKEKMSFITVDPTSDFSFHNLPYGIFSTSDNVSVAFYYYNEGILHNLSVTDRDDSRASFSLSKNQNPWEFSAHKH